MKPIKPTTHGLIDYATVAAMFTLPGLLGLNGAARTTSYMLASTFLLESALTDYKPAVKRVLPFQTHGKLDLMAAPAVLALPAMTGAMRGPRARTYFLGLLGMIAATWMLTDWQAQPQEG